MTSPGWSGGWLTGKIPWNKEDEPGEGGKSLRGGMCKDKDTESHSTSRRL